LVGVVDPVCRHTGVDTPARDTPPERATLDRDALDRCEVAVDIDHTDPGEASASVALLLAPRVGRRGVGTKKRGLTRPALATPLLLMPTPLPLPLPLALALPLTLTPARAAPRVVGCVPSLRPRGDAPASGVRVPMARTPGANASACSGTPGTAVAVVAAAAAVAALNMAWVDRRGVNSLGGRGRRCSTRSDRLGWLRWRGGWSNVVMEPGAGRGGESTTRGSASGDPATCVVGARDCVVCCAWSHVARGDAASVAAAPPESISAGCVLKDLVRARPRLLDSRLGSCFFTAPASTSAPAPAPAPALTLAPALAPALALGLALALALALAPPLEARVVPPSM